MARRAQTHILQMAEQSCLTGRTLAQEVTSLVVTRSAITAREQEKICRVVGLIIIQG